MDNNKIIIDVREKDEFQAEHIPDSIHIPLSQFQQTAPGLLKHLGHGGKDLILMCGSGKRAALAKQGLGQVGDGLVCEVFVGGIQEWKRQGKPTVVAKKAHLPIMRQVQLVAGSLVFASSLGAAFSDPRWIALSAFIGAGLTFAGATGFCGMAEVLARMPWNKGASVTACDKEMLK